MYSTSKGYTYQRINTDCVPMRPSDVTRLAEERRGLDWSATSSGRTTEDVNPFALRYCRRLLSSSADPAWQRYAAFTDMDLLRALKLVAEDRTLTRAGELLVCDDAASGPNEAIVYQHKRTQAGESDAGLTTFQSNSPSLTPR